MAGDTPWRVVDRLAGMVIMPDVVGVPSPEELASLPAAELAVRLAEAYRLIAELTDQAERLATRVQELERQARKDRPPRRVPPRLIARTGRRAATGRCGSEGNGGRESSRAIPG
jgi:hypothetical protein